MLKPPPQWQPISRLPLIAHHIDDMLQAAQEQYQHLLLPAKSKPHLLDDYTVNLVIRAFTTQQSTLWLFDEQLRRWQSEQLTVAQRTEVERLVEVPPRSV